VRQKAKGERRACYICMKHRAITEQHHLNPIKNANNDLEKFGEYESTLIWLCPNHHKLMHFSDKYDFYGKIEFFLAMADLGLLFNFDDMDIYNLLTDLLTTEKERENFIELLKLTKQDREKQSEARYVN